MLVRVELKMSTSLACVSTLRKLPFTLRHSFNSARADRSLWAYQDISCIYTEEESGHYIFQTGICSTYSRQAYVVSTHLHCDATRCERTYTHKHRGWALNTLWGLIQHLPTLLVLPSHGFSASLTVSWPHS